MKVRILKASLNSYWYADKIGEVFEVKETSPQYSDYLVINNTEHDGWGLVKTDVEIIKEEKQMKATDTVSLELTGRQLAKIYAIHGKSNGSAHAEVWAEIKNILDPDRSKYDSFMCDVSKADVLNYNRYEDEWLNVLFSPVKTPEQIQLETVMQKIEQLTQEANTLKGLIESK